MVVDGDRQLSGVRVESGARHARRRRHVVAVPVPGTRRSRQRQRQLVVPGHRVQRFGQVRGPFQDHFLHTPGGIKSKLIDPLRSDEKRGPRASPPLVFFCPDTRSVANTQNGPNKKNKRSKRITGGPSDSTNKHAGTCCVLSRRPKH